MLGGGSEGEHSTPEEELLRALKRGTYLSTRSLEIVDRIALSFKRRMPAGIRLEDLVSAGRLGLTEAAENYDETRGEPFEAFALKRINGAIIDYLRSGDILSRRVRTKTRRIAKTVARLEHALGRRPDNKEIAEALGVALEVYQKELAPLLHVRHVAEADAREVPTHAKPADELIEKRQLVKHVRTALASLPERDQKILTLYYFEDLGLAQIGEILGVSETRVFQLKERAMERLREFLPDVR